LNEIQEYNTNIIDSTNIKNNNQSQFIFAFKTNSDKECQIVNVKIYNIKEMYSKLSYFDSNTSYDLIQTEIGLNCFYINRTHILQPNFGCNFLIPNSKCNVFIDSLLKKLIKPLVTNHTETIIYDCSDTMLYFSVVKTINHQYKYNAISTKIQDLVDYEYKNKIKNKQNKIITYFSGALICGCIALYKIVTSIKK
jgi:hypothetical protein